MGANNCVRRGCENSMCDTHIPNVGYLCNSCVEEYKVRVENENISTSSTELFKYEIVDSIQKFVDTEKTCEHGANESTIDKFLSENTITY